MSQDRTQNLWITNVLKVGDLTNSEIQGLIFASVNQLDTGVGQLAPGESVTGLTAAIPALDTSWFSVATSQDTGGTTISSIVCIPGGVQIDVVNATSATINPAGDVVVNFTLFAFKGVGAPNSQVGTLRL